jgi:uncharacterized SAM-dependent methyltransferase
MSNDEDPQQKNKKLDDFYRFFKGEYIDMLPYIYAEPSDAYKRIVKDCEDYYIFRDEVENIENNKEKLTKYLANVKDMIEIGPGFNEVMTKKTLPIVSCANKLKRFFVVDSSACYLDEACEFLRNHTSNIEIHSIEADLMSEQAIRLPENKCGDETGQKCILFLGSTLGNFTDNQRYHVLKQLHDMIDVGDLVILTADTNLNGDSVVKAYTGEDFNDFARCALWHFIKINSYFDKHVMSFDIKCRWNEAEKFLLRYFVANEVIKFKFGEYGEIKIEKDQELSGYKCRKDSTEKMVYLLKKYFSIVDILSVSGKMKTFICQKK